MAAMANQIVASPFTRTLAVWSELSTCRTVPVLPAHAARTPSDLATRLAQASNSRLDGAYVANLWMHTWS